MELEIPLELSSEGLVEPKVLKKQYLTNHWHPINFACFMEDFEFVQLFFEQLNVHLSHALDVNPVKVEIDQDSNEIYPNKNRMLGLIFAVWTRNSEIVEYLWRKTGQYLSGWNFFQVFKQLLEIEHLEGIRKLLQSGVTFRLFLAMPAKNRAALFRNLRTFCEMKLPDVEEVQSWVEDFRVRVLEEADRLAALDATELFDAILKGDAQQVVNFVKQHRVEEVTLLTRYHGQADLSMSYTSSHDRKLQTIRAETMHPLALAICFDRLPILRFFVENLKVNLFYSLAKPGILDYSDTCDQRLQCFPLIFTVNAEKFETFQYLFEVPFSAWRVEHLRNLLDEVVDSGNPTLMQYLFKHPRTHVLFNYLAYLDKQLLIGYLLLGKEQHLHHLEPLLLEKPYRTPYVFYLLANPEESSLSVRFKPHFV